MEKQVLSDICEYRNSKIATSKLNKTIYISTENMIPNKGGILESSGLPNNSTTQEYKKDDVLVSNIRPYFKKIWHARSDGGCSNDVLVFSAKPGNDPTFLYYVLSDDKFFEYAMASSKGTKMPRGDKNKIMSYEVPKVDIKVQKKIASILCSIDEKIEINNRINGNLSKQAFSLFDKMISIHDPDDVCSLCELAEINPKRSLEKNKISRCIDMSKLSTTESFPIGWEYKPYTGGVKFTNGDTLLARITPCLENGKTAYIDFLEEGEIAFGSTEFIVLSAKGHTPYEMLYCLARNSKFVEYAVKNMNGSSGRQRVSGESIGQFLIPRFTDEELLNFGETVKPMFLVMKNNSLENIKLASLRDNLLPRLISGELDVSVLDL